MDPTTFFADYKVDSTEQETYETNGKLNLNAANLIWYASLDQASRQIIQQGLVNVGYLTDTAATGEYNSTTLDAFQNLVGAVSQTYGPGYAPTYLDQVAGGTSGIQNQISANLTKATESATQPIVASVENPTTLSADITAAFETALGYSPDQTQIQSFISQVQGQDTTYAEAPRTEAQQQIDQAHSEESALNKLGPDGIDSVIQAYQAAVNGTKMPGAGTVQGPVNGAIPNPGTPIGSPLQPGTVPTMTSEGQVVGGQVKGTTKTTTSTPTPAGGISGFFDNFANFATGGTSLFGKGGDTGSNGQVGTSKTTTTQSVKAVPNGSLPANTPNTTPTYGGLYALSAADWKKAQDDYAPAKKYATPGSAPESVQLGAFSAVLQSAYDSSGSWSKAVASIASGSPFGTAEGTHLSNFGNQVAAEVNSQIDAVQNQVNNDTVTTKVTAPDATAEADLAAKQSDPTGYYAAQDASWGSVLNKMLSGTPDMYDQASSDTFTGPVASEAEQPTMASAGAV